MTLVLYRKYRPKTFEEVVGQEHVVTTLRNALRLNRVGHAYLFVGPRGTGKTTLARLLARYVNCVNGAGDEACRSADNACISCVSFFRNNNPDLMELDAASNRGIDEIRQLREGVRVVPVQSAHKVYIIDEAHMLTKDAANAFLKTLEEPPAHAIFVLATTDVEKLPVTLLSRCQRFDLRLLTVPEIVGRLSILAQSESAQVDQNAIELLAEAADGSIRDAESLLEQVLAFLGKNATYADTMRLLGIPDPLLVRELADAILAGDTKRALENLTAALHAGGDATTIALRVASYLRDVLLLTADAELLTVIEKRSGAAHAGGAMEHATSADQKHLMAMVPAFIDAVELTKHSPIPQLPLELAVIEHTNAQVS